MASGCVHFRPTRVARPRIRGRKWPAYAHASARKPRCLRLAYMYPAGLGSHRNVPNGEGQNAFRERSERRRCSVPSSLVTAVFAASFLFENLSAVRTEFELVGWVSCRVPTGSVSRSIEGRCRPARNLWPAACLSEPCVTAVWPRWRWTRRSLSSSATVTARVARRALGSTSSRPTSRRRAAATHHPVRRRSYGGVGTYNRSRSPDYHMDSTPHHAPEEVVWADLPADGPQER
jgi:hypothetical protein